MFLKGVPIKEPENTNKNQKLLLRFNNTAVAR